MALAVGDAAGAIEAISVDSVFGHFYRAIPLDDMKRMFEDTLLEVGRLVP